MGRENRMIQYRLAWFRHAEEVTRSVAKDLSLLQD
jgi:hypothetical protein